MTAPISRRQHVLKLVVAGGALALSVLVIAIAWNGLHSVPEHRLGNAHIPDSENDITNRSGPAPDNDLVNKNINDRFLAFDALDKILRSLPKGAIAFNTPPPVNIDGPAAKVELRVDLKQSPADLAKSITVPGHVQVYEVQIANRMSAKLCCDSEGLKITPITPTLQAVSGQAPTIWRWSIKPLKAGQYPVSVELDAEVKMDGEDSPRLIDDFNGTIAVTITPRQRVEHFAKDNWQWLWTALLVPVGGWWWKRKAKKDEIDVS